MTPPVGRLSGTCRMKCPKSMTCHIMQKIKAIHSMSQRSALAAASCHANCHVTMELQLSISPNPHRLCHAEWEEKLRGLLHWLLGQGLQILVAGAQRRIAGDGLVVSHSQPSSQVSSDTPLQFSNVLTCHRIHPNLIFDLTFPYVPCSSKFPWPPTHSTNQLSSMVP